MVKVAALFLYSVNPGKLDPFNSCDVTSFDTNVKDNYVDLQKLPRLSSSEVSNRAHTKAPFNEFYLRRSKCSLATSIDEIFLEDIGPCLYPREKISKIYGTKTPQLKKLRRSSMKHQTYYSIAERCFRHHHGQRQHSNHHEGDVDVPNCQDIKKLKAKTPSEIYQ